MPLGESPGVLEVDVRVVEGRAGVAYALQNSAYRAGRQEGHRRAERYELYGPLHACEPDRRGAVRSSSDRWLGRAALSRSYEDAPCLPDGERIDVKDLVAGEWFELEVGPGRGWFLFERAAADPRPGLVGLEVRRKWASVVDERLRKRGLGARARVFAEDANAALARLGPDGSVMRVFVHFPDPWWKKRHQKRLVIRREFVEQVARLLPVGGELFVQTDVEERAKAYEDIVAREPRLVPLGDAPGTPRIVDNPYGARSPRERRAIADGLPVYRMRWVRAVFHSS
jgi:tRNA (guanine-N7-)-methyltransferase